jgi:hypothetical protein
MAMRFEKGLGKSEQAYEQYSEISSIASIVKNEFFNTWQWWLGVALFITSLDNLVQI